MSMVCGTKLEIGIELLESTVGGWSLGEGELKNMSKLELRSRIMRWDTARWRNERESKTTLAIYNRYKREIVDDKVYVNDYSSGARFSKIRTNCVAAS